MRKSHITKTISRVRRNRKTVKKYMKKSMKTYRVGGYVSGANKHPRLSTKLHSNSMYKTNTTSPTTTTTTGGTTTLPPIEKLIVHLPAM